MKIKVMWYNVLRGFHKKEEDGTFTFEKERLEATKKIVGAIEPDILVLGEADFGPLSTIECENVVKMDYQKLFDYPFSFYTQVTERKGEVVLSKFPLDGKSNSTELFSNIRCKIKVLKKEVVMDIIHPYPKLPEAEKANKILSVLKDKFEWYILLGDFNALSPEDAYSIEELTEGFRLSRKEGAEENAKDAVQCLMIKEVLKKGMIDAFRAKNKERGDSFPTKRYDVLKNNFGSMRLDYLFCSPNIKVVECMILRNKLSEIASDHYPIYAILELNGGRKYDAE